MFLTARNSFLATPVTAIVIQELTASPRSTGPFPENATAPWGPSLSKGRRVCTREFLRPVSQPRPIPSQGDLVHLVSAATLY